MIPLVLENVGNSPARIKEAKAIISDPKEEIKFTFHLLHEIEDDEFEFVIFPNDPLRIKLQPTYTPEDIDVEVGVDGFKGCSDKVAQFNELFGKIEKWIKEERFVFRAIVKYSFFDNAEKGKVYTTYRLWVVEPGGKGLSDYYCDIN